MSNKTVEQIYEDVREYLTSIGPCELPSETQIEEFADEFVAAHEREMNALARRKEEEASEAFIKNAELTNAIAEKYAEIERLKFEIMQLKSVQRTSGEVIIEQTNKVEAKDAEIEKLRALVGELTDALDGFRDAPCDSCMLNRCPGIEKCKETKGTIELIAKAREVVK